MRRLSFYLLLVFVFAVPWENAIEIGGAKTASSLIGMAAIGLTLVRCLAEGRFKRPPTFALAFAGLVYWQLTTYFWSLDPSKTVAGMVTMVQLLAMVWLIAEAAVGERERLQLMQAFVLGCVIVSLVLVYAYLTGGSVVDYRFAPAGFDPNQAACLISMSFPMALLLVTSTRHGPLRWLNVACIPLGVFAVVLTASRTGFIAACVGLVAVFFALGFARATYRVLWSAVILATFAAVFYLLPVAPGLEENIGRVTFSADTESLSTLTGRTEIWAAGQQMFYEHPVGGMGLSSFMEATLAIIGKARVSHNLWIQTAAETGVVGLGLLAVALGAALLPALRCRGKRVPFHLILFLTLMITSSALDMVTHKELWIVLALLSVARPTAKLGSQLDIGSGQIETVSERQPGSFDLSAATCTYRLNLGASRRETRKELEADG